MGTVLAAALEASLILALMLVCWLVVYATGGIKFVFSHLMYIPIILAAFRFHFKGGVAAGIVAGILLGPFMPILVSTGEMQELHNWLIRLAIFCAIGGLVGFFAADVRKKNRRLQNLVQQTGEILKNVLAGMTKVIEGKDKYTRGQSIRVAHNAYAMGRAMGLPENDLAVLHWSGLLHDLGKVWVPVGILNKKEPLTSQEYDLIKKQVVLGHKILTSLSPFFDSIAEAVRHHHERWDGRGYPDHLAGEDIPLFARILAVANVFEALTSERAYRPAMTPEKAVAAIRSLSGTHFDPLVVEAFNEALAKNRICLEKSKPYWVDIPSDLDMESVVQAHLGEDEENS